MLLIYISNFIYLICGGDRIDKVSKTITIIIKYISKKNISILNFDCASIEISK
jgi:hypothetical protein